MAAAVSGDVNWGMTEDAVDTEDLSLVDWRVYQSAGNTLNDKMQKMAERIRSVMGCIAVIMWKGRIWVEVQNLQIFSGVVLVLPLSEAIPTSHTGHASTRWPTYVRRWTAYRQRRARPMV